MTTAVATWKAPEGGWASDGTEELPVSHPMITLTPPIAATKDRPAGEFFHSDTERSTPTLEVVILFMRETRALFEDGSNEPICRSDDGKIPARDMPVWEMDEVTFKKYGTVTVPDRPVACDVCPFSEWDGSNPPVCGNSYLLLVDRGDGDLAQLRVKGTSIKPFKDWVAKKPRGVPMYCFKATVTAEERRKDMNRWFEMKFKAVPLEEEEALRYDALMRSQAHRFEPAPEEPEEVSAFMAEVSEVMQSYILKAADVAKFTKLPFTEANILTFMKDNGYEEVDAFLAAAQRELETLPFS